MPVNESAAAEAEMMTEAEMTTDGASGAGADAGTGTWEPRIVAFCCNWCSYAGADLAGTSRKQYPANIRIVRVPCSGRINPQYILRAFQRGADGVMVAGCHPGDCHYTTGNYYTRRRFSVVQRFLEYVGLHPDRFSGHWISGSEGEKFVQTAREFTEKVRSLGPNEKMRDVL